MSVDRAVGAGDGVTRRQSLGVLGAAAALAAFPGSRGRASAAQPHGAAPPPTNGQGFYRFKVGDFECLSIGDGQSSLTAHPAWGADRTAAEVDAVLEQNLRPTRNVNMYFQPMIIRAGAETLLIDTGNGAPRGLLVPHMSNAGLKPSDITAVLITHMHGDHVNGMYDASGGASFANARYFVQKNEMEFWSQPNPDLSKTPALPDDWKKSIAAASAKAAAFMKPKAELIGDGDKIVDGVRAIAAPGHTPGLQMIEITGGSERLVVANDVVHHEILSFRNPDWPIFFDADLKQGAATRRKVLDMFAADRVLVLSYHMPFPGLGRVRRDGDAFQWVPEPWNW